MIYLVEDVDDKVKHRSSPIMNVPKNSRLQRGGVCDKSLEDLFKLGYIEQSHSTAGGFTNGTTRHTSLNHPTSHAENELLPVKTELDDDNIVTNEEIKVEPSSFEAELSLIGEGSATALFQEHRGVLYNKDSEIVSSDYLQSSTSQCPRDVGELIILPVDKSVNLKDIHCCGVCSQIFRRASLLKRHEKSHIGVIRKSYKKRNKDNFLASRRRSNRQHCRLSRQISVDENQIVGTNSSSSGSSHLKSRIDSDHNDTENLDNRTIQQKCAVCSKLFRMKDLLEKHEYRLRHCQCSFCPKRLRSRILIKQHENRCHNNPDEAFKCDVCSKECGSKSLLKKHVYQCQIDHSARFECSFCSKKLKTETKLMKHTSRCQNNPAAVFKCTVCSNEFASRYLLKNHEIQCKNIPSFKCSFCSKEIQSNGLLKQHESQCRSNLAAVFICTVCSKEFGSKYFLRKHEQSENHGVPKEKLSKGAYACPKCSCSYANESYLTKHKCKPYACAQCDSRFSDESRLKNHEVIHASPRPFSCEKCFKRFTVEKSLKLHELSHLDTRPFPCQKCDKSYVELRQLQKHEQMHECDLLSDEHRPYQCTMCPKRFVEKIHLNSHLVRHMSAGSYSCNTCGKKYAQAASLESHMLVHTGEKPHACPKCGKPFRVAQSLKYHMLTRHMARPYACRHCGKCFSLNSLLEKHVRALHAEKEEGVFMCTQCGKELSSAYSLKVHERQHAGKRFQCDECDKCYSHQYSLKLHKVAHKEKPFACTFCDEKFAKPSELNLHIRQSHFDERPHMCPKCGMTFTTPNALMKHEECHREEKPFACAKCGTRFAESAFLARHQEIGKCGNRKFACTICGQRFAQNQALNVHMRTHTGERPYKCTQCYKSFIIAPHLKEHMESVHSVERPFECLKCMKTFPTARYLKAHDRSHQVAKSFVCPKCGKSFSASCGLKQHIRMHNGERPFSCVQCSARFTQQSGLHHHIVLMHGDKVRCSWNAFDLMKSVDQSNSDSLVSLNNADYYNDNNTDVKTNVEMNASVSANISSNAIAALTVFDEMSNAMTDYFVPSPARSDLNDDGLTDRIKQALSSLNDHFLPKTEPQEHLSFSNSDSGKQPVSSVFCELQNKTRKPVKMADISLNRDNRRQVGNVVKLPISSVVSESENKILNRAKMTDISPSAAVAANLRQADKVVVNTSNSVKLSGELMKTFLLTPEAAFDRPGLSSATSQHRTENTDEIMKKQIESDDDTVIDDDDGLNNNDHFDSDNSIKSPHNGLFAHLRRDTVSPLHDNIVSPHREDVATPQHNKDILDHPQDLSLNRRDEVLSDDSDTIEFNDLDTAEESEKFADPVCSASVEPSGSVKKANAGNCKKMRQLEMMLSQRDDEVDRKNKQIKLDQLTSEECLGSQEGSKRAPKRRKRGKRMKSTANADEKRSKRPRKSFSIYTCSHCSEKFKNAPLLVEHAKEVHEDLRPFKCEHCDLDFGSTTGLKLHEVRHTGARPFACTECDKTFTQAAHVQAHIRLVHFKERPFACTQCDKRFPLRTVLRNHERATHSRVRKYICDQCGQGCATAQALKVHVRIHTDERPYACTLCESSFHQAATLSRHMSVRHSTMQPHMCVKCGKTFPTTTQRNRHELRNCSRIPTNGENQTGGDNETKLNFTNIEKVMASQARFPCETCGKKFTQRSSLKIHNMIHAGELPYECPVCGRHFRHNSSLRDHANKLHKLFIPPKPRPITQKSTTKRRRRRKKTQEKMDAELTPIKRELQCALCDKSYNIATCLRRHVRRVHEGIRPPRKKKIVVDEKPYVCEECGVCYADSGLLKEHLVEHS